MEEGGGGIGRNIRATTTPPLIFLSRKGHLYIYIYLWIRVEMVGGGQQPTTEKARESGMDRRGRQPGQVGFGENRSATLTASLLLALSILIVIIFFFPSSSFIRLLDVHDSLLSSVHTY